MPIKTYSVDLGGDLIKPSSSVFIPISTGKSFVKEFMRVLFVYFEIIAIKYHVSPKSSHYRLARSSLTYYYRLIKSRVMISTLQRVHPPTSHPHPQSRPHETTQGHQNEAQIDRSVSRHRIDTPRPGGLVGRGIKKHQIDRFL